MADILSIGRTGLSAAKKSLETTGHNIANVNTEGFSRQRVEQTHNTPISQSGLIQGTGTRVRAITRAHDPYIEKRLQKASSESAFFGNQFEELTQIENIFNEIDGEGLNQVLNRFYNSFRELGNQPENDTIRSVVRDNANLVVNDFKRIRETLDNLARNIDHKVEGEVEDINTILKNVTSLNKKIAQLEAAGDETSDLRDQRDLAVRELSKSFKIHTYLDEKNNFNVSAVGVGTLVSGGQFQELAVAGTSIKDSANGMDGAMEVYFKERPSQNMSAKIRGGKLASMIKSRNEHIKNLQDKVDNIAFEFANTVNAIHRRGFVARPVEEGPNGEVSQFDAKGATTGINFFEVPVTRNGAAMNLSLSQEVSSDLGNIITGLNPNSPGDNRVAIAISKLQHERFMDDGTATLEEHYLKVIGNIGLETGKAKLDQEQSEGIKVQLETLRERTSGVNIDEETSNLVRFQHAYEASAKVMQTANEMFDTILSIKR
ncbi:MAG: flagellar hook-associated protein FlgK [Oligoflexia bacterium]|nr:flagellar hook-associated protein FlgK [Oligoflexia bacterium]